MPDEELQKVIDDIATGKNRQGLTEEKHYCVNGKGEYQLGQGDMRLGVMTKVG